MSGEEDWSPRYNIAPTQIVPVIRQNPKQPVRESVADALGTETIMGQRLVWRGKVDQREVGNGGDEARIPRCVEITQGPDSRRWFL